MSLKLFGGDVSPTSLPILIQTVTHKCYRSKQDTREMQEGKS